MPWYWNVGVVSMWLCITILGVWSDSMAAMTLGVIAVIATVICRMFEGESPGKRGW